MLSLPHSRTLLLLYSCSCSVAFKRLDNPSFHPWFILVLATSPSKTTGQPFFPFLLLLCRLQKAGQPFFPSLSHSCSPHVTFKRLDNPYFHSCSIPVLALLPSKDWITLLSIPALALSPSKGWTTLISILAPFLFLLCCLQKAGHPFFPFLSHSCSCPSHLTIGWTSQYSTLFSIQIIQTAS